MEVIPAINETSFLEVRRKIKVVEKLNAEWVHLDVTDGVFTPGVIWNNPKDLADLKTFLKIEIHLMAEKPENQISDWLKSGAHRLIVHAETLKNADFILSAVKHYQAAAGIAIKPATAVEVLKPFLKDFNFFQILAVNPGWAGQKFQENVLEKIKDLRALAPDAKIEVDGGLNLETAKLVKTAGADIIVSSSYIFSALNPRQTFEILKNV